MAICQKMRLMGLHFYALMGFTRGLSMNSESMNNSESWILLEIDAVVNKRPFLESKLV